MAHPHKARKIAPKKKKRAKPGGSNKDKPLFSKKRKKVRPGHSYK